MSIESALSLNIRFELDAVVVRLVGDGSNDFGRQVRETLAGLLADLPSKVTLDLSGLEFINSIVVGVVVEFVVQVKRTHATLELIEARGMVLDVLERCSVAEFLKPRKPS